MTALGWRCVHYGVVGCQVDCETVICLETLHQNNLENIKEYNINAAQEIARRKQPDDFVICFYGDENKHAAESNNDLIIVEPSIGYSPNAVFAPYRVFVSYAQMHYYYGLRGMIMTPSWNDAVIYNPITASEFDYTIKKDDYILYFGRVVEEKGLHIAIQAAQATGKTLVVAGPGDLKYLGYTDIPQHVEVVGVCDVNQRKQLMSKARAIIGPTYYLEPFGNMIAEGYMSGTPAITTDWGGFTENVVHGVTGFRCREFRDFVDAINNIDRIESRNCLEWALQNCEDTVVHFKHDQYLKKIQARNFYR